MIKENVREEKAMENQGQRYIAVNFTREDFLNLNLSVESDSSNWEKAVRIFNDRIKGRFLDPIRALMKQDINKNGFAVMALDCLLVETLYQFYNGVDKTLGSNREQYTAFLQVIMPDVFGNRETAELFYLNIRCGILHSAQTKKGCQLTFNKEYVVERFEDKKIRVNVEKFTEKLREYYKLYQHSLLCEDNELQRQAFIKKMNYICNKDE